MNDSALPVIINKGGGTAAARGDVVRAEVEHAFAAVGLRARVALLDGGAIGDAVTAAAGERAIVVGGGDGTLGCAAGALAEAGSGATLGILPLGTHNHLARDLGIPLDLAGAARVIADGHVAHIDTARANERLFLNNASIGLYPALVQRREAVRRARGIGPKWLADLPAAWSVLKRARHHRLHLLIEGERTRIRTPLLFVGNNRYGTGVTDLGRRASLQDGILSVLALDRSTRLGLLRLAVGMLAGRTDPERDLAAVAETPAFEVHLHGDTVEIALDGEVARMEGPLRFAIHPATLPVFAPTPDPGTA